ncbi:MAG: M20 family metallopeptidase [Acidobacteria bacterium]|nr:M20 family metallopeptidase [Acidobacteriota bacterium]
MNIPGAVEQLRYFRKQQSRIVETVRQLVEIESPSDLKQAVDRLGTVVATRFREIGGRVRVHHEDKFGDHLQIDFGRARAANVKPILLLGHLDTVYPMGTISKMPCRTVHGKLHGPGVLDMKSGIAIMLHALEGLRQWNGGRFRRPVRVWLVSDEEVGSSSSRRTTESLARSSEAVLVLEPAAGANGAVKTARKGVGEYTVEVTGKAAHSGLDFEKGENAVVELARQILEISKLVDPARGITVNVGKASGGTRVNVVPAEARAWMDLRISRMADGRRIDRKLHSLRPFNPNCRIRISGGINRPPMERNSKGDGLYAQAAEVARELGWKLEGASVGGGSDGNFTAALGIPTLDGLGAVGEGAHAEHEYVVISELPRRAALVAGLMAGI